MNARITRLVLLAAGSTLAGGAIAAPAVAEGQPKITICHRTNSDTNPYVEITVAQSAVDGTGGRGDHFNEHVGPIWNENLKRQHIEWGDIIPAIPGVHGGRNWESGEAWLENGCENPGGSGGES